MKKNIKHRVRYFQFLSIDYPHNPYVGDFISLGDGMRNAWVSSFDEDEEDDMIGANKWKFFKYKGKWHTSYEDSHMKNPWRVIKL